MIVEKELWNHGLIKNITYDVADLEFVLNDSEDKRVDSVTRIAAISRGNDKSNNPTGRYKRLLKEAAPNGLNHDGKVTGVAGRPLEFAPIKLYAMEARDSGYNKMVILYGNKDDDGLNNYVTTIDYSTFLNELVPFSHIDYSDDELAIYTNIRACLNSGIPYKPLPYSPINNYLVLSVKAPYFVFAQIRTHGRLSQIAASERVITENEYWLPNDVLHKVRTSLTAEHIESLNLNCIGCDECKYGNRIHGSTTIDELVSIFLELPVGKVQAILKLAGYHKEIYNRWPNHLKYKTWMIGGYLNDPKAWDHLLLEREAYPEVYSSWVQAQTKEVAVAVRELIESIQ